MQINQMSLGNSIMSKQSNEINYLIAGNRKVRWLLARLFILITPLRTARKYNINMLDKVSEKYKEKTHWRKNNWEEKPRRSGSLRVVVKWIEEYYGREWVSIGGDETACSGNPRRHLTNLILLSMILYDNRTASLALSAVCCLQVAFVVQDRVELGVGVTVGFSVSLRL